MSITRRLGLSDPTVTDTVSKAAMLVLRLLDGDMAECVRRCAVPKTFDQRTFDEMLRTNDRLSLDQLAPIAQISRVPAEPDRFRMADGMRRAALSLWWPALELGDSLPVPEKLAELAGHLAKRATNQDRVIEELDLLVLHSPEDAAALFVQLFDEADQNHDLSACKLLLDTLDSESRRRLLGPNLTALRGQYGTRLARREYWSKDYYRSAFYVARPNAEAKLLELLTDEHPPILEIFADGGMGKTMQLRWFIARYCTPREIPCVRLDFDDISPIAAARHPWLLLLEAAAQLDGQLDRQPFQELLGAHGHYRTLLALPKTGDHSTAAPRTVMPEDSEDIRARFASTLSQLSTPVVVILDTFEQLLHGSVVPDDVVATLAQLANAVPQARIVLSGRYSLADRAPEILPQGFRSLELDPLTHEEQQHYLGDIRGIDDPAVVREIVRLSEGRPLTLSIYAELINRSTHALSADEVASWRKPGIVAAIQRYVARIEDNRVRWLIRYGVIPRRLRFPFVQAVLWPYIAQGMTGDSSLDDPNDDTSAIGLESVFATDLEFPDESAAEDIWHDLREYASDYGWISIPDVEPDALAIRSDVVQALRNLISDKKVFAEIQGHAADYFEGLAREFPDEWLVWTRESLYHRLRQDTDLGTAAWEKAIDFARSQGNGDWCLELATSLLNESDFVDWNGAPLPPMTAQLLAHVQVERARAATAAAVKSKAGPESPLWDEAEAGLIEARALVEDLDVDLPDTSLAVIEAQLELGRGDPKRSAERLRAVRHDLGSSQELASLEGALGRALLGSHDRKGVDHLESSYRIALEVGDLAGARDSAMAQFYWYTDILDTSAALAVLTRGLQDGVLAADSTELSLHEGFTLALAGMATKARKALAQVEVATLSPGLRASPPLIEALARARIDDHEMALRLSDQAIAEFVGESWLTPDDPTFLLALKGSVYGETFRMAESTTFLLAAAARARELRDHDAAAYCAAGAADYLLGYAGDLEGARQCLDEAKRSPAEEGSDGWLHTQMVQASLHSRLGDAEEAASLMHGAIQVLERIGFPPAMLGLALARGLAFDGLDRAELVAKLARTSREVPVLGRPAILNGLRYVPLLSVDETLRTQLVTLLYEDVVRDPAFAGYTEFERAALEWSWAETMRLLGLPHEARSLLDSALEARHRDMFGWWRWLDGMERLGPPTSDEPSPDPEEREDGRDELSAVCQILLAERRIEVDSPEIIEARLRTAAECLADRARLDRWVGRMSLAHARLDSRRADKEAALRSAAEAASSYSRLGDASAFTRVTEKFAIEDEVEHRDTQTIVVTFELPAPGTALLTLTHPDGERTAGRTRTERFGDISDSGRSLTRLREVLGPLTKGWNQWSREVAEVIMPSEIRRQLELGSGPPRDVCLQFDVRDLAALPWELTGIGGRHSIPLVRAPAAGVVYRMASSSNSTAHQTRALQRSLQEVVTGYAGQVTGIYQPRTKDAVRRFQASASLPETGVADRSTWAALRRALSSRDSDRPLRATLVQIGTTREMGRQRGYAAFGTDPATAYSVHGWDVEVWEDFDPAAVAGRPRQRGATPDLVHVVAPIRLSGGSTVLDLAGNATERSYSSDGSLTSVLSVTGLSDSLSWLGAGAAIPIVLLDIPHPQSPLELVRSLALRNSFAYQLLRLGRAQSVLCTGLAEPRAQVSILENIVGGLARGMDITEVARTLQCAGEDDDLASTVAFAATALYLERPPFTYLPPGYTA